MDAPKEFSSFECFTSLKICPSSFLRFYVLFPLFSKAYHAQFVTNLDTSDATTAFERPHCGFMQPVYKDMFNTSSEIVATMQAGVPWDRYLVNLLPPNVTGIHVVLSNTCNQSFTYTLDGNKVSNMTTRHLFISDLILCVSHERPPIPAL